MFTDIVRRITGMSKVAYGDFSAYTLMNTRIHECGTAVLRGREMRRDAYGLARVATTYGQNGC
ncbi:MAG: hypothetical protein ACI38B_05175, partial [Bifidobacterium sp.]|uniref:hypothetical protein n=1 Tax=Bifidobacterium sp. TaxID=41200 RepID=UPI003F0908C2